MDIWPKHALIPVGQTREQLVNSPTRSRRSHKSPLAFSTMELDEIFCPDASDLPPPAPDYDDALEM